MTQLNTEQDDLSEFDKLVEQTAKLDPQEVDTEDVPQTFNWFGSYATAEAGGYA